MKKLYYLLVLIFIFSNYGYAQATYDIVIAYERQPTDDKNQEFQNNYSVSSEYLGFCLTDYQGNTIKIKSSDNTGNSYINELYGCCFKMPNSSQTVLLNYKNVSAYQPYFVDFAIAVKLFNTTPANTVDDGGDNLEFDEFINPGKSQLLLETYMGNFYVQSFKPNVSIGFPANRNPATGTKTLCANEQFGVFAYPEGFPPEIYNWQYSLDNKATWRDVPDEFHKANPNFTIFDLLGNNHLNYIGKTIYFRMGYNSMLFAGGIEFPLFYSSCAPLVGNIEYLPPFCNGDNVRSVTVTFDRDLYPNEELHDFQLKAVNTSTNLPDSTPPIVYPFFTEGDPNNGLIKKLDEKSPGIYSYSMSDFKGLNPNATYQIRYQAFDNNINKGLGISIEELNIKYKEPEPVIFEIVEADNPKCANDAVEVSIDVSGGTGSYLFYVDGTEQKNPKPVKEADGYYHIRGLIPTAVNSIKVTDENGCIEK
ncbi:hypothetical protein [Flavobacterium hydrophilum]|uniref:Uncharacterized protein n=1 Tax=Flavobacterium hydrophilum TaxID=2211445 RepID=A0A2V4C3Y0_9FLAO|nr:hypothetical protein [Flavobacterium hydrophilum]PXY46019.1 hypothetical protein DMB68_02195 [Flavobacterium hydrophilum]